MTVIRPDACPPVTAVAAGDIFLIDGATGVRALAATSVAFTANSLAQFAATTSAQLRGVLSDETGTGSAVFANAPTLVNPTLGVATATSINGNTWTTGTGVLTIATAKTLTASNSLTLAGTDGTTQTFPATSATLARTDAGQTFTGTQTFGALTATTVNGNVWTAGTGTLTLAAGKTLTASNSLTLAGTDGTTQTFPSTSGTVVTSVSSNVVTNAMRAQMAAATLKGNVTAGTANEADFTIQGLTNLAGPSATLDFIPIYDHVSGTIKNVTPGAIASSAVAGVASLNGQTGALAIAAGSGITVTPSGSNITVAQSLTNATLDASPANPTSTASTAGVMMGMGSTCKITPVYSGRVKVTFTGSAQTTAPGVSTITGRFADSAVTAVPANGASPVGTIFGNPGGVLASSTAGTAAVPYTSTAIITGLTIGHLYWFDQELAATSGGPADIFQPHCTIEEF